MPRSHDVPARRAGGSGHDGQRPAGERTRPAAAWLLWLQRAAGNRAVAGTGTGTGVGTGAVRGHPAGAPTVQRAGEAPPGDVEQAVDDLYGWLVANAVNRERLLMTLLLQKGHRELEARYNDKYHRDLRADFDGRLSWDDAIRAKRYLDYGGLRLADKLFIAIHGKLTDLPTVVRLAPQIRQSRAAAESDFAATYAGEYGQDAILPDGSTSPIAGAVLAETLWADFADRFRILAVLAFGAPRAADDVKIATVQAFNDADLLFNALQREDPKKIAADFEASYREPVTQYLGRETSLHTKARALMFFDENVAAEDRLIRTVEIATSGYTTADTDFIFDAVAHATPEQVAKFKAALGMGDRRLKDIDATFGGMSTEDRDRLNALLGIGEDSGILGDPAVRLLRSQGGNSSGTVFTVLRDSTGTAYDTYRKEYANATSPLRRYVDQFSTAAEKGWLASYVFADFRRRLDYVISQPGMDDYLLFLLNAFADPAVRRELATDRAFGSKVATLGTATQNRILLVLEPAQLSQRERAVWLDEAVRRETGSGIGSITGAASALQDENRELQAAVARAGKNPTAEQQAEIDRLTAATRDALTAFVRYRDELEAAVASAVEIAAGLVAGVLTGGAATVELALAAIARAAVASAMAKVVSHKLVKGDRFDVLGADGAQAFVSGAVDGMLNAVAPGAARLGEKATAAALEEAMVGAARAAAPRGFAQFASTVGPKMAEGAIVGGLTSAVDTAAQDRTWAEGFDHGVREILLGTVRGAVTGGALGGLPPALGAVVAAAGGLDAFEAIVAALPEPEAALDVGTVSLTPRPGGAAPAAVQRQQGTPGPPAPPNWGLDFEDYATTRIAADGLGGQLPPMQILVNAQIGSGQGIDRIGFAMEDNELRIYHFEMKWANPAKEGRSPTKVEVADRNVGLQTGEKWSIRAITEFCEGRVPPSTLVARDMLRARIPSLLGHPPGTVWSTAQLKDYLLANLRVSRRVLVVPPHVNVKRLWMQLLALTRWDKRRSQIVRVPLP